MAWAYACASRCRSPSAPASVTRSPCAFWTPCGAPAAPTAVWTWWSRTFGPDRPSARSVRSKQADSVVRSERKEPEMAVTTIDRPSAVAETRAGDTEIHLRRRSIDKVLVGMGLIAAIVFAVAGGLLMWGSTFANDYVHDELSSQKVFFPDAASLREDGRDD